MTRQEKDDLIVSIENASIYIVAEGRAEIVDFVLKKYGAKSIEDIPSVYLSEVFNELDAIEADLRSG